MSIPTVHAPQPAFAIDPGVVTLVGNGQSAGGGLKSDQIFLAGAVGVGVGALLMAGGHQLYTHCCGQTGAAMKPATAAQSKKPAKKKRQRSTQENVPPDDMCTESLAPEAMIPFAK